MTEQPIRVYRLQGGGYYHAACFLEAGEVLRGRVIESLMAEMPRPQCCSHCKGDGETPLKWHPAKGSRAELTPCALCQDSAIYDDPFGGDSMCRRHALWVLEQYNALPGPSLTLDDIDPRRT